MLFLSVIGNENEPWELVQFCMRELQWKEGKESITKLRDDSNDLRFVTVMNDILAVYEDKWEDEDLYIYYSK
jgi:hypothetical protein